MKRWLRMFRVRVTDNSFYLSTPLFAVIISDGEFDFCRLAFWYGMWIGWSPHSTRRVFVSPYKKQKQWDMKFIARESCPR